MKKEKFFNSVGSSINKKNILLVIFLTFFIMFLHPIKNFYDENIIQEFLKDVQSAWYIDTLFIILLLLDFLVVAALLNINRKFPPILLYLIGFSFILFFICRYFLKEDYEFYGFTFANRVKYADFITILFVSCLVLKIKDWMTKEGDPPDFQLPFILDSPITTNIDDKFSRKDFADKIAQKIQSKIKITGGGSLAIGINGVWGSGKTSFTFLIKEAISKVNTLILDFNPWRSSSSTKIVENFFKLLATELSRYDSTLSSNINEYAKTLIAIDENRITKAINSVSNFLVEDVSNSQSYERINNAIAKSKKQIIIFIDDLDRLDTGEIIEVLRIIRNTANFNNVIYVVSYDKDYVLEAIKEFNKHNYKSFLEKIFQFEFTLPSYEDSVNRETIKKHLKEKMAESFFRQIDWVVDDRPINGLSFTNEVIKTQRDAVRLVNSLLFEIEPIKNEVLFYDFYLLQLIKLKYPKVYNSLMENRYKFFVSETDDNRGNSYRFRRHSEFDTDDDRLWMLKNHEIKKDDSESDGGVEFAIFLNDIKDLYDLTTYDIALLMKIVEVLLRFKGTTRTWFGDGEKDIAREKEALKGFYNPRNYHKYFAFRLFDGDVSDYEFEKYRVEPFENYNKKVQQWVAEGKYPELKDRLIKIEDFSDAGEFENHIRILFELGRLEIKETNPYMFDYSTILKLLQYPVRKLPGKHAKLKMFNSEEEYQNFILSVFNEAPSPQIFEGHIISRLIILDVDFVLSPEKLAEINLNYFKKYVAQTTSVSPEFWQLFYNCRVKVIDNPDGERHPEAIAIAKNEFKRRTNECELGRFIKQTSPYSNSYYINEQDLMFAFTSVDDFESWFKSSPNINRVSNCYKEFLEFFNDAKGNALKPIIFEFKFLNPISYA